MKTITITLDEYEVSNLRELLKCCGFPHDPNGPAPFAYNTGDWLGQLWWKLEPMQTEHQPNRSIAEVRNDRVAEERGLIERTLFQYGVPAPTCGAESNQPGRVCVRESGHTGLHEYRTRADYQGPR